MNGLSPQATFKPSQTAPATQGSAACRHHSYSMNNRNNRERGGHKGRNMESRSKSPIYKYSVTNGYQSRGGESSPRSAHFKSGKTPEASFFIANNHNCHHSHSKRERENQVIFFCFPWSLFRPKIVELEFDEFKLSNRCHQHKPLPSLILPQPPYIFL